MPWEEVLPAEKVCFITEARGVMNGGRIGVAPAIPGKIVRLPIGERQYRLNTGAFWQETIQWATP